MSYDAWKTRSPDDEYPQDGEEQSDEDLPYNTDPDVEMRPFPVFTEYTFRWFRHDGKILYTDESFWNPDEPELVDWFLAVWLQEALK